MLKKIIVTVSIILFLGADVIIVKVLYDKANAPTYRDAQSETIVSSVIPNNETKPLQQQEKANSASNVNPPLEQIIGQWKGAKQMANIEEYIEFFQDDTWINTVRFTNPESVLTFQGKYSFSSSNRMKIDFEKTTNVTESLTDESSFIKTFLLDIGFSDGVMNLTSTDKVFMNTEWMKAE